MRNFNSGLALSLAVLFLVLGDLVVSAAEPVGQVLTGPQSVEAKAAAIAKAQQVVRTAEARGDKVALVKALNDEADAHLRAHEFDPAEKLRLRVLRIEEERAGRDSLPVADALLNLGWFYGNVARYEAAQGALDRCLDLRRHLLGAETAPVAEVLNALGVLEENRSNLTLAEAFYQQAISIQEKTLGLENPITANTWNNLATLYWITGDYASAQNYFNRALAVREKAFGPNSIVVAKTLNNLALLESSLGDYDEAEATFQRALKIRIARLGEDDATTITTLGQLGLLYVREGDDARAQPLLERTVEMRRKTYQIDHPDLARGLMQLALLYDRKKQFTKSEPLLAQALAIRRKTLGTAHPEYAASLAALARHDHAQGRLTEARPLYQQALKIDSDILGKNHPDTLAVSVDLACLQIDLGHQAEAATLARDVAEAQQHALNSVFTFAPERQRMNFEKTIEPCDLPAATGDADLLARVVLRTKGVVLDSLLEDGAAVRAAGDSEVRELMEKKRLLAARMSQAQEAGVDFSVSPEALAQRKELETEERELEASLAKKGIGSGRMRRALETELGDVRQALPKDAALVEFVSYNRYLGKLHYEPAYGAVVITRNEPSQWVPLGSAAEIDARVRTYQKYMRIRVRETAVAEVLGSLYKLLCQPVWASLPAGIHRLVICPDGNLNFVSFATLLDPRDHFFGEDFDLHYVSSGRDLLERGKMSASSGRRIAIFADPDYGHVPGADAGKTRAKTAAGLLAPLPGTEKEALFLEQMARSNNLSAQIYRGAEASKANLAHIDSPHILHLATHGLYLSPDEYPNLSTAAQAKAPAAQAMSRSLLALAGASVTLGQWKKGTFPTTTNDGLLTAQDVAGLNLDRTWLVVLSACDSGTGEAQAGEGVLGLRRGFAEAGAQNLLTTLWTVDDSGTADLMEAFYREALRTGDAPGALARGQRESLVETRKKAGLLPAVRKAGPFVLSY